MFLWVNGLSSLKKCGIQNIHLIFITISGGFVASFLLIALVVAAAFGLRLSRFLQHAFTQAYYYAIMSSIL